MATEKLEQLMEQLLDYTKELASQLAELTEQDLAKATTRRWAPTVGEFLTGTARHKRDHIRQIMTKRESLGLGHTPAQKAIADIVAAQSELYGALLGLTDEDLDPIPEGQTWSIGQVLEHMSRGDDACVPEVEKAVAG